MNISHLFFSFSYRSNKFLISQNHELKQLYTSVSHRKLAQRKNVCGMAIVVVLKDWESVFTCVAYEGQGENLA